MKIANVMILPVHPCLNLNTNKGSYPICIVSETIEPGSYISIVRDDARQIFPDYHIQEAEKHNSFPVYFLQPDKTPSEQGSVN